MKLPCWDTPRAARALLPPRGAWIDIYRGSAVYRFTLGHPPRLGKGPMGTILHRLWTISWKAFFVLQGPSNTDKSVLGNLISRLFPSKVVTNLDIDSIGDQRYTESKEEAIHQKQRRSIPKRSRTTKLFSKRKKRADFVRNNLPKSALKCYFRGSNPACWLCCLDNIYLSQPNFNTRKNLETVGVSRFSV